MKALILSSRDVVSKGNKEIADKLNKLTAHTQKDEMMKQPQRDYIWRIGAYTIAAGKRWNILDHKDRKVARVFLEEQAANLIAAAPELLEALENITQRYSHIYECCNDGWGGVEDEDFLLRAQQVIAKARGE